jgi:Transposase DDE domain
MPRKRFHKVDEKTLEALRKAEVAARAPRPATKTKVSETVHDAAADRVVPTASKKPKFNERDLKGLRYFSLLNPLLEGLHECGTQRDLADNRILHFDQYCSLVLLFYFNPIVDSLRGIQQASRLGKVQKTLGCERSSLGSLSEAARVFDSKLLRELIPELAEKLLPTARGKDAKALQGLIAVDGSLLPALPKMVWALWLDDDHRAAKMHVHFDVFKGIPSDVTVTHGSGSEREQLRIMLLPGRVYVIDRGYAEYQLFQDIVDACSSFIARVQDDQGSQGSERRERCRRETLGQRSPQERHQATDADRQGPDGQTRRQRRAEYPGLGHESFGPAGGLGGLGLQASMGGGTFFPLAQMHLGLPSSARQQQEWG